MYIDVYNGAIRSRGRCRAWPGGAADRRGRHPRNRFGDRPGEVLMPASAVARSQQGMQTMIGGTGVQTGTRTRDPEQQSMWDAPRGTSGALQQVGPSSNSLRTICPLPPPRARAAAGRRAVSILSRDSEFRIESEASAVQHIRN